MQYESKTQNIHRQTQINQCTVKWAQCDKPLSKAKSCKWHQIHNKKLSYLRDSTLAVITPL